MIFFYAINVPEVKQSYNNTCGIASALQVIYSFDLEGRVSGSTFKEKETNIARNLNVTPTPYNKTPKPGAMVYQVVNTINNYSSSNIVSPYGYINCNTLSYDDFIMNIKYSFSLESPVIIHCVPRYLTSYYPSNDKSEGHYIVVESIDTKNGTLILNDCHYNSKYNGIRKVTIREAYKSLTTKNTPRYIIGGGF